jgi:putative tryptophan/tyrosine transport system substrate-binding protein
MKRREFIAGLLLAATMRRAKAQQTTKVYRIAIVYPSRPVSQLTETGSPLYRALFEELRRFGYVEGQKLLVERYSGEGRGAKLRTVSLKAPSRKQNIGACLRP